MNGKYKLPLTIALIIYLSLSIASLISLGHIKLWEAFTYPSYGGLIFMLSTTGLFSVWLSGRWSRHPHTSGLLAGVLPMVLPFMGLAAVFFIFGWWYSRLFFFVFFLVLFVLNLALQFGRSRQVTKVAATSPAVVETLQRLGVQNVEVGLLENLEDFDVLVTDLRHNSSNLSPHLLSDLAGKGKEIVDITTFTEGLTGKVDISTLSEEAEILLRPKDYIGIKRIWETVFVLLTAPLWLLIAAVVALLVRLDSPGPVIFKQRRIGLFGQPFDLYKFRSMHINSETSGPKFAEVGDARVTRVGAFIRKFRLDEIPQLWNVLKGDMGLIGPRPEQEIFAKQFAREIPFYETRHLVRPGLTGWAQVVHGYASDSSSTKEKLAYDLYYVKNFSFWLDLLIVLKTLSVILRGFGAR
ncbi:sugar transferase [Meiothermus sp.]|uniref:sugar transferase n=1 Tax=Meiothermus sp. TaxID=1955249 RepID=UPI00262DFECF|nr:sugar transferase [Meiothermus sp.]